MKKDAGAPRKNLNAYMLYIADHREEFKARYPGVLHCSGTLVPVSYVCRSLSFCCVFPSMCSMLGFAYLVFIAHVNHTGEPYGEIQRLMAEAWHRLDDMTRASYERAAAADKQRYEAELSAYESGGGVVA